MPNLSEMFPSKYLRAGDLNETDRVMTVKRIEPDRIGQDDKWVLYFREDDRGLVLNKTNTKTIAKLYGDDTDGWIGKQLTLFPTEVDFQGEMVEAIRIRSKAPKPTAAKVAAVAKMATEDEDDADIPF